MHHTVSSPGLECPFANCSAKWIPQKDYADHLTLHQLQSQQAPNTDNDELIAFNHQTQILQQQTDVISGRVPDPLRICTSSSLEHLRETQKPVIPIHDALSLGLSMTLLPRQHHKFRLAVSHNVDGLM